MTQKKEVEKSDKTSAIAGHPPQWLPPGMEPLSRQCAAWIAERCADSGIATEIPCAESIHALLVAASKAPSVRAACASAGVNCALPYQISRVFPPFMELLRWLSSQAVRGLELAVFRRAVDGVEEPLVSGGEIIGSKRVFDTRRELAILASKLPDEYGKQTHDTGV